MNTSFTPLTEAELGEEALALRETILETRAPVAELVGLLAPDGSLRGPFDPLLRSPAIGHAVQALGLAMRSGSELEPAVFEAVVLVVAGSWGCEFEWNAHTKLAARAGALSDEEVGRIADGSRPELPRLALACEFASQQVQDQRLDEETWKAALAEFGERGVVELTMLVSYYETISRLMRTCNANGR